MPQHRRLEKTRCVLVQYLHLLRCNFVQCTSAARTANDMTINALWGKDIFCHHSHEWTSSALQKFPKIAPFLNLMQVCAEWESTNFCCQCREEGLLYTHGFILQLITLGVSIQSVWDTWNALFVLASLSSLFLSLSVSFFFFLSLSAVSGIKVNATGNRMFSKLSFSFWCEWPFMNSSCVPLMERSSKIKPAWLAPSSLRSCLMQSVFGNNGRFLCSWHWFHI